MEARTADQASSRRAAGAIRRGERRTFLAMTMTYAFDDSSSGSAIGAAASSARAMLVAHSGKRIRGTPSEVLPVLAGEHFHTLRSSRRAFGCGVAGGRRRSTCHSNRRREGACSMSAPSAPSPPAAGGANGGAGCDATDHAVEMFKIRELIKSLQAARG